MAVGLVAGVIIGVTSYVIAAPSGGSVKVCVKSGVVVSSTNGKCPARAKLTKVNKRGPRGPAGPPGSPGGAPTATVTAEPSVIDGGTP